MKLGRKILNGIAVFCSIAMLSSSVNAAITGLVIKDNSGNYIEYNYKDLNTSYLNAQRLKPGAALYNDYINKGTPVAFKDDKKGYVDYSDVNKAYVNAQAAGNTSFDANQYTETCAKPYNDILNLRIASVDSNDIVNYSEVSPQNVAAVEAFIVDSVDTVNKVINTRFYKHVKYTDSTSVVDSKGNPINIANLKKFDVIYLRTDSLSNQVITVYQNQVVEGKIESRVLDGSKVKVNGIDLAVSDAYNDFARDTIKNCDFGSTRGFVLDKDGKVIYVYNPSMEQVSLNSTVDKNMMIFTGATSAKNGMTSYSFIDGFGKTRTFTGQSGISIEMGAIGKAVVDDNAGTITAFTPFVQQQIDQLQISGQQDVFSAVYTTYYPYSQYFYNKSPYVYYPTSFTANIDDSAVVINQKSDGSLEVINGYDAKNKYKVKPQNVQYFVLAKPDEFGMRKIIFVYTKDIGELNNRFYQFYIFNDGANDNLTQVGADEFIVNGYFDGLPQQFVVSKYMVDQMTSNYTVAGAVNFDENVPGKISSINYKDGFFYNGIGIDLDTINYVSPVTNSIDEGLEMADFTKIYKVNEKGDLQLSNINEIKSGMHAFILNSYFNDKIILMIVQN